MAAKRKRWRCRLCGVGVLGPRRPRRNDAVRYCLPCTASTGRLVERYAPSAESKANRKEAARLARPPKASKPRNTKLAFMREGGATITVGVLAVNYWPIIRKMAASKRWAAAAKKAGGTRPDWALGAMRRLWDATVDNKGGTRYRGGVRVSRGSGSGNANEHTVNLRLTPSSHAYNLALIVHELTHTAQFAGGVRIPRVNGKRRVHNYNFHVIMLAMARTFFGYEKTSPYENGWSVGRGYEPDRRLTAWLKVQVAEGNPKVMRWISEATDD